MDDLDRTAKQALIDELDSTVISPEKRAAYVYRILNQYAPNLTRWDIICFAVNYLGYVAPGIMWLQLPAKHLARLIYTAHYMDGESTDRDTGITDPAIVGEIKSSSPHPEQNSPRESPSKFGGFNVSGGGFNE